MHLSDDLPIMNSLSFQFTLILLQFALIPPSSHCLESTLAEPIIIQQQMSNLLNSTFAGEAKHNNPSHCLAFYNTTPEDQYASVDARLGFLVPFTGFVFTNLCWSFSLIELLPIFGTTSSAFSRAKSSRTLSVAFSRKVKYQTNRTAAGPLTIIRYCPITSKSIPTQHPVLAPALRTWLSGEHLVGSPLFMLSFCFTKNV